MMKNKATHMIVMMTDDDEEKMKIMILTMMNHAFLMCRKLENTHEYVFRRSQEVDVLYLYGLN